VQDADEPVGELAQRGTVSNAAVAEVVVIGARSWRGAQCAERLLAERVDESVVVNVAGQDGLLLA
jgi:methyl coenzyme M reductase subunit C